MARSIEALCLGIAEQGKVYALQGKHGEALRQYREALRLAVSCAHNELFFHHCTQCIMESLELSGAHELVADFCIRAEDHFATLETDDPMVLRQRAANLERLGVSRLQTGDLEAARALFQAAVDTAGKGALPLSEFLLGSLRRGLSIRTEQLRSAQRRHRYFIVRKDLVDPSRAVESPQGSAAASVF